MMKRLSLLWLPVLITVISIIGRTQSLQSFEAGVYPITTRIQQINAILLVIENRLTATEISSEEITFRKQCLAEYIIEKNKLEIEYTNANKINQLPWVTYLTNQDQQRCLQGLTIPEAKNTTKPNS